MTKPLGLVRCALILAVALLFVPRASAWGCKGHQTIALIAESLLKPQARAAAEKILADDPIDPALKRYCDPTGLDPFADSSTWADDYRSQHPETGDWHFIDIPRGTPRTNLAQYCPPKDGCVTGAIADQLAILRLKHASAQQRGAALRFLIHFVGDIHQPLHDTTNNDRGGNCVPIAFFDKMPMETNAQAESYSPNLHGIWDTNILEKFTASETPQQFAASLVAKSGTRMKTWQGQPANFMAWAWESHELAETVSYGKLPHEIPVEKPVAITSCADDNHVAMRMLQLDETIGDDYENASQPVIEEQLAKAGARLAALLNSIWP
jgi:S1/P1 Nuclease